MVAGLPWKFDAETIASLQKYNGIASMFAGFRNCALVSSWHGDVPQYLRSYPGGRFFHTHGP
jgi:hypothetical protein